jgi:hypothetical protein
MIKSQEVRIRVKRADAGSWLCTPSASRNEEETHVKIYNQKLPKILWFSLR